MTTATLIRIDPRYPGVMDTLAPFLEKALGRGGDRDWGLEDVAAMAVAGNVQLWALVDGNRVFGACVTQEILFPRRKMLEILLTGTDPHTETLWVECLSQLKLIAKSFGASCLAGTGRPGWSRKLGADRERTVWEIDL